MEGKGVRAVIMGLLILGLVVSQTTEAKSCSRTATGRNCYNVCRRVGTPRPVCAAGCDCIIVSGNCPPTHPRSSMLENSDDFIEEVTTDLEASQSAPIQSCPTDKAKKCFERCRLNHFLPKECRAWCGCVYVVPGLDLN